MPPVQIRVYSLPRTRFCVERDDEVQMAPRGAICWFVSAAGGGCSERRVGIELGRRPVGNELFTPGLLDLWTVDTPQSLAQQLQALEDRQRLLGRPVRRQRRRLVVADGHGLLLPGLIERCWAERCFARAASRSCASLAR